jgi:prepilin peptidase CpaA
MPSLLALSYVVPIITAGLLLYIAVTDLKEYTIRNELVLVLAGLFFLHAFLSGHWITLHWNILFAAFMFTVMLYFYSKNHMGGGDLKILAVSFLWVGIRCALVFALFMLVFAIIHTVAARFGWVGARDIDGRKRIAFAPSIAAALISTFLSGCLHQPQ